jgi:protein-L-isoaspartate(D-aspartate) O-methyltransferase
VVALEQDPGLAAAARQSLNGVSEVTVVEGPLTAGWPALGPYDVILLDGAAEVVPPTLLSQLTEGGRLIGIVGDPPASHATLFMASQGGVGSGRPIFNAVAGQLPGFSRPRAFAF